MSLRKWGFKNGPGSVGQSAKTTCKAYSEMNCIAHTIEGKLIGILQMRNEAWKIINTNQFVSNEVIISYSNECLALFAYNIAFVEATALHNVFRQASFGTDRSFVNSYLDALDVIYEVVKVRFPDAIKLNFDEYKEGAIEFSELYLTLKLY